MRNVVAGAFVAASLAFFSIAGASQASAQIVNGNFDDLPALTGWNVTTGVGTSLTDSLSPERNATFNEFNDILQQTFTATAGTYVLSFYVKTAGTIVGQYSFITAAINNVIVAVGGAGIDSYAHITQTVTLKDGSNTLRFTGATFFGEPDFLRLDNVSITAVPGPIPGAGVLSFIGLAGAGLLSRVRRRRKAA